MSKELALQQQTLQTQSEPPEIEIEIECPRCYDIMTLCYDFDRYTTFVKNVTFHYKLTDST